MEKYCKSCGRVFKDSDFKLCPYCGNKLSTRTGRQPIPRKLRHQVFQRDGYRCRECGATNKQTRLHVDHIVPVAKGGTNDLSNLQTLCEACNRAKYTDEWVGGQSGSITHKSKSRVANYKPKPLPYFNKIGMKALEDDRKNRKLWNCPNCGKTYNAKTAKKCPHCDYDLKIDVNEYFFKDNNMDMKKFSLFNELQESNDDFIYKLRLMFLPSGFDSRDVIIKYLFDNYTPDKIENMINTTKKNIQIKTNNEINRVNASNTNFNTNSNSNKPTENKNFIKRIFGL